MGAFPQAALDIKPVETANPLDQFARVTQIRSMLQNQQLQAQQVQMGQRQVDDDEKMRSAWQSSGGDPDQYIKNLSKQGVGAKNVIAQSQALLAMKKSQADLDDVTLKNNAARNDQYRGKILSIVNGPQANKQDAWDQEITAEEQAGKIQPGTFSHQYPGDDVATSLANHLALGSTLAKEAIENKAAEAKQQAADTGTQRFQAELPKIQADTTVAQQQAALSPGQRALQSNLPYQAAGGNPQATRALQLETNQKAQQAAAAAKAQMGNTPAAVATVPPHLVGKALDDYNKVGQEYAAASQTAQNMNDFLSMAKAGNKVAVKVLPLEGALEITTAQGVHRINKTEVDQYGGGGSLYDRIAGKVGDVLTGKNIPDSVLSDMASLQQKISANATNLYGNKLKVINQAYGAKFQPIDFGTTGGSSSAPVAPSGPIQKAIGPNGHMIRVENNRWVDDQTGAPLQ
jgi:hypothetical protein